MEERPTSPLLGYAALNLCTILWGTQHAVIKILVVSSKLPTLVNALRFSAAAVVTSTVRALIACATSNSSSTTTAIASQGDFCSLLMAAAELSVYQTLGFTFQIVGLHWTTASRSAFLLYLNATIVPVIATILGERDIGIRTWACVLTAVAGTLLLVHDGGEPNIGDLWSFGAACWSAMFIIRLTKAVKGL